MVTSVAEMERRWEDRRLKDEKRRRRWRTWLIKTWLIIAICLFLVSDEWSWKSATKATIWPLRVAKTVYTETVVLLNEE